MNNAILIHAAKTDQPVVAETMSLILSKERGDYVSTMDAYGEMDMLRLAGLLMPCAPHENTPRTTYVCMALTEAGREAAAAGADEELDNAAFQLWVRSQA